MSRDAGGLTAADLPSLLRKLTDVVDVANILADWPEPVTPFMGRKIGKIVGSLRAG